MEKKSIKQQLRAITILEEQLNLKHKEFSNNPKKYNKKTYTEIYNYFQELYQKAKNPKITYSEMNDLLEFLKIKIKINNEQWKIIQKLETKSNIKNTKLLEFLNSKTKIKTNQETKNLTKQEQQIQIPKNNAKLENLNQKAKNPKINNLIKAPNPKLDIKINDEQLKIIRKLENELKLQHKKINIEKDLGTNINEYFEKLVTNLSKTNKTKVSDKELSQLLLLQKEKRFLPGKNILKLSKPEWYNKIYYLSGYGKNLKFLTKKQHFIPRTLLKRWADKNDNYYSIYKKTNIKKRFNTMKYQGDPFYGEFIYEIAGNSIGNMIEHAFVKLEVGLKTATNNIIKNNDIIKINDNISINWIIFKNLIQYLICSKYRTKSWFVKSSNKNLTNNYDKLWAQFNCNKPKQ